MPAQGEERLVRIRKSRLDDAERLIAHYLFLCVWRTVLQLQHRSRLLNDLQQLKQEELEALSNENRKAQCAAEEKAFQEVAKIASVVLSELDFIGEPFWGEYAGTCPTCRYEESWRDARTPTLFHHKCTHSRKHDPDNPRKSWPCRDWRATHNARKRDWSFFERLLKHITPLADPKDRIDKWLNTLREQGYFAYEGPPDPDEF